MTEVCQRALLATILAKARHSHKTQDGDPTNPFQPLLTATLRELDALKYSKLVTSYRVYIVLCSHGEYWWNQEA
jgi:hypothetical protein